MTPPRMTAWRWLALVAAGLVCVFAADAGWSFLGCVAVVAGIAGAAWSLRRQRVSGRELAEVAAEIPAAPVIEPIQRCPSCDVYGAPLAELCGDRRRWQLKCFECGHMWFDPPTHTTGMMFGRD